MTLKTKTVLAALDTEFGRLNFQRLSKHHRDLSYYKWRDRDVRQSVGVDLRMIAGVVRIDSPNIGLRFDSTEKLVARFEEIDPKLPQLVPEDIARRGTLGFLAESQTVFASFFRSTWNICKESEVEPATADFVRHVMKVATPFWDKYSDPEVALDLLQRDDEEARNLGGADHFRAERAVTMTFLRRGPEEAKQVAEAKLPKIRHAPYAEEFRGWMTRFFDQQDVPVSR